MAELTEKSIAVPTDGRAVAGPRQGQWTGDAWEALDHGDGIRYEIINGVLYMSTAPSFKHQWVVSNFYDYFGLPAKQAGLAIPIFAPIGVFMPGVTPVQPDFLLVLRANAHIIRSRRIYGVPDVIVEVTSPGSHDYDEGEKLAAYAAAGVPEYAVARPQESAVAYYKLIEPGRYAPPLILAGEQMLSFGCLPGIEVAVARLFEGAVDDTL